jgi:plasmid stabilization system protein ParE
MTSLLITGPVYRQIAEIHAYIARDSVPGADNVVTAIHASIDLLRRHPKLGRRALRSNMRMIAVDGFPYLIFFAYFRRLDEVRIRSIRHAARRRTVELREPAVEFRV